MYTTRSDKPLDPITLVVVKALHLIAAKHKASYFIIGAGTTPTSFSKKLHARLYWMY